MVHKFLKKYQFPPRVFPMSILRLIVFTVFSFSHKNEKYFLFVFLLTRNISRKSFHFFSMWSRWSLSSTATEEITATNEQKKINFLLETVWTWTFRIFRHFSHFFLLLCSLTLECEKSKSWKTERILSLFLWAANVMMMIGDQIWWTEKHIEPGNEIWRHLIFNFHLRLIECVKNHQSLLKKVSWFKTEEIAEKLCEWFMVDFYAN